MELAVEAASREAALLMQAEVVARVPVKTGKLRELFASTEAVQKSWKYPGGHVYGLVTPRLKSDGFYARFVEYGTKGYSVGDRRAAGWREDGADDPHRKSKRRGLRFAKIKRNIPPRPAHPFFRPAIEAVRARVKSIIAQAAKNALKD